MSDTRPTLSVFDDAAAIVQAALEQLSRAAAESVAARGRFTLALAGGTRPRALYLALAERADFPWQHTELCFGDERCVPPDHAESNARMVREALTHHAFVPATRVHRVRAEAAPADAARDYETTLRGLFPDAAPFPRFDMVLLGLGADGHTASLFPHTPALDETARWVRDNPGPAASVTRITLTFPVLNAALRVLFLVVGADKHAALARLLSVDGSVADTPARGVRPSDGTCAVFADKSASAPHTA